MFTERQIGDTMRKFKTKTFIRLLVGVGVLQEIYHIARRFGRTSNLEDGRSTTEKITPLQEAALKPFSTKYQFTYSPIEHDFRVNYVDCKNIINNDDHEIRKGENITVTQLPEAEHDLSIYMQVKHSCRNFKDRRGYIDDFWTQEEREFPIAFSVLIFKEFSQFERLMRTIYRPQNYYCIHVDLTADPFMHALTRAYVECFGNMHLSQDVVDIVWGDFSLSEGELVCMYELLTHKKWKYFINLTGQEFPLKTNLQMVKILKEFNGANDLSVSSRLEQGYEFRLRWDGIPPHDIVPIKGSNHVIFSREAIEFITRDTRVKDYVSFLANAAFPEEALWNTLNLDQTLRVPGGFNGSFIEAMTNKWTGRVKWWQEMKRRCSGRYTRNICVFGVKNLHSLVRATEMIANKLYWDHQPATLDCLEEWMYNRTRDEYLGLYKFDITPYRNLPIKLKMFSNLI